MRGNRWVAPADFISVTTVNPSDISGDDKQWKSHGCRLRKAPTSKDLFNTASLKPSLIINHVNLQPMKALAGNSKVACMPVT